MSASISISMDISCIDSIASRLSLNRDRAQALLDSAIKRDTDPYVPMRQGTLASSVLRTPSGRGEVVYDTPYARRTMASTTAQGSPSTTPLSSIHWRARSGSRLPRL